MIQVSTRSGQASTNTQIFRKKCNGDTEHQVGCGDGGHSQWAGWTLWPDKDYKYITWNINGVNAPQKRRKLFHHLGKLNSVMTYLQETYI